VATVPRATTVPASGLCNGLGEGGGHGATRGYSSGVRPLYRAWQGRCESRLQFRLQALFSGPGKGLRHGANRDCSSHRRCLLRAWQGARPRCDSRLQFRFQAFVTGLARGLATVRLATTVPVSGSWHGPCKSRQQLRRGASHLWVSLISLRISLGYLWILEGIRWQASPARLAW